MLLLLLRKMWINSFIQLRDSLSLHTNLHSSSASHLPVKARKSLIASLDFMLIIQHYYYLVLHFSFSNFIIIIAAAIIIVAINFIDIDSIPDFPKQLN